MTAGDLEALCFFNNLMCPDNAGLSFLPAGWKDVSEGMPGFTGKPLNIMRENLKGFKRHEKELDLSCSRHAFSVGPVSCQRLGFFFLNQQMEAPWSKELGMTDELSWVMLCSYYSLWTSLMFPWIRNRDKRVIEVTVSLMWAGIYCRYSFYS